MVQMMRIHAAANFVLGGWLLAVSREFAGWAALTATYTDLAAEDGLISGR